MTGRYLFRAAWLDWIGLLLVLGLSFEAARAQGAPTSTGPAASIPPVESFSLTLEQAGGRILTLEESIQMAIRGATMVLKAENEVEYTGTQLLQAYGQFLPNLTGTGSFQHQTGTNYFTLATPSLVTGSLNITTLSLQTDLNIFNGLSDYSNLKSALLKKDAADLTLYRAKQRIALDVIQNYLQVILNNQLVKIASKNLQESREREKLLLEQTKVGARNLSDLFRQQAQTSQDESAVIIAQNHTRSAQILLLKKLRLDAAKSYHFIDPQMPKERSAEESKTEEELIGIGLERRADLRAADGTAEATRWDTKATWGRYLPTLDLGASVSSAGAYVYSQTVNGMDTVPAIQNPIFNQLGKQLQYSVGIYLTWNIFDRFLIRQNVEQARVAASNSRIDAEDRRIQVTGDVRQAYGDYLTAQQELRSSKKGLEAAQKAYEVMEGRYEVGSMSFLDLITAQAVLVQAESARAEALIDFQLQRKSLEFAVGETKID